MFHIHSTGEHACGFQVLVVPLLSPDEDEDSNNDDTEDDAVQENEWILGGELFGFYLTT